MLGKGASYVGIVQRFTDIIPKLSDTTWLGLFEEKLVVQITNDQCTFLKKINDLLKRLNVDPCFSRKKKVSIQISLSHISSLPHSY